MFCFAPLPTLHWTSITSVMPVLWCTLITLFERIHWPREKAKDCMKVNVKAVITLFAVIFSWQEAKDTWREC